MESPSIPFESTEHKSRSTGCDHNLDKISPQNQSANVTEWPSPRMRVDMNLITSFVCQLCKSLECLFFVRKGVLVEKFNLVQFLIGKRQARMSSSPPLHAPDVGIVLVPSTIHNHLWEPEHASVHAQTDKNIPLPVYLTSATVRTCSSSSSRTPLYSVTYRLDPTSGAQCPKLWIE